MIFDRYFPAKLENCQLCDQLAESNFDHLY